MTYSIHQGSIDMNELTEYAKTALQSADAALIGASNGLSISEGYNIFADNDMFQRQFGDFRTRYGIHSVLDGVFARHMSEKDYKNYMLRLVKLWTEDYSPSEVMTDLCAIIGDKPCFILTTNADEHLEKAGFPSDIVWEIEGTFRSTMNGETPKDKRPLLNRFLNHWSGKKIVILELGIGSRNRLIKLPLMQLALKEPLATYITLNLPHEIYVSDEIAAKSIALPGDIAKTLKSLRE